MSNEFKPIIDAQIAAICDALAGDAGFMAQQEATALQKRAGEVARGQEDGFVAVSLLAQCAKWHASHAGKCAVMGRIEEADMHLRFAVACAEADEQ